ncbi:MAG: YfhO family protein [Bacteroidetes bacterium]|nr:YfhO family protein [Bacteroidota bacterium]
MKTDKQSLLLNALLIIVPLVAFLPITLGLHPLKYDMVTTAYPWRYFIGECLQNHILPLWNPYQHMGYPIHADPQSGVWYLPAWIIGYLAGYNLYTLSIEFLGHIILAGFGFRWLARNLEMSALTSALLGLAYACSGFFVGHGQHLPFIISGTWLPFILASFIRSCQARHWRDVLLFSVFTWLLLTGGYPGFTVILVYMLAALWLLFVVNIWKSEGHASVLKVTGLLASGIGIALLLALPQVVSFIVSLPYITRGGGTSIMQAMVCPFSPRCTVSFLYPLATVAEIKKFDTDISLSSAYIGLIPLALFLISLFYKDNRLKLFFVGWAAFCLLASMGDYLPVRPFLYHYIPLMNFFRMPGIFRLFVILGLLIAAGFSLDRIIKGEKKTIRRLIVIMSLLFLINIIILIINMINVNKGMIDLIRLNFFTTNPNALIRENLVINAWIIGLLAILGIVLWFRIKPRIKIIFLLFGMTVLDLMLMANIIGPYTVYSIEFRTSDIHHFSGSFHHGFTTPSLNPMKANTDFAKGYKTLWLNMGCFFEQVNFDGYNPFALKEYEDLQFNDTASFHRVMDHPVVFLKNQDTSRFRIFDFNPDDWRISVNAEIQDTLCLLQNNYPGWKIRVNGQETKPLIYQKCFLSVPVNPGKSSVEFVYHPHYVAIAWIISVLTGLSVLFLLIRKRIT